MAVSILLYANARQFLQDACSNLYLSRYFESCHKTPCRILKDSPASLKDFELLTEDL